MNQNMDKEYFYAGMSVIYFDFLLVILLLFKNGAIEPLVAGFVGSMLGLGAAIVGFYWGSSRGSKEKTALLEAKPSAPKEPDTNGISNENQNLEGEK